MNSSANDVLATVLHRKVRRVVAEPGFAADRLMSIAAGGRRNWTPAEWQALLAELDACDDSVRDWIALRA
jgi:hypothetical protein